MHTNTHSHKYTLTYTRIRIRAGRCFPSGRRLRPIQSGELLNSLEWQKETPIVCGRAAGAIVAVNRSPGGVSVDSVWGSGPGGGIRRNSGERTLTLGGQWDSEGGSGLQDFRGMGGAGLQQERS